MEIATVTGNGAFILYDAGAADQVSLATFDLEQWRADGGLLAGSSRGRASAWFLRAPSGNEYVWRHYRRGGLPGRLIADRYLYLGLGRSRPWREFLLTAELWQQGLPVPRPHAARLQRSGIGYSADLITGRLPGEPLSAHLERDSPPLEQWQGIGTTLARFHRWGLDHADLNAHNILLGAQQAVYLIDLDRGCRRPAGRWREGNIARLRRSLDKLKGQNPRFAFDGPAWRALLAGYRLRMQGEQDD